MQCKLCDNSGGYQRVAYWDNVKFALIVLVVVEHMYTTYRGSEIIEALIFFISFFHMPLFIFVSGLFHSNKNLKERVVSLLLLRFVYKIILFIVSNEPMTFFSESKIPWFLCTIAFCSIITYFIKDMNKTGLLIMSIILGCMLGYDEVTANTGTISRTIGWYPFYLLGSMVDNEKIIHLIKRRRINIIGVLTIMSFGLVCLLYRDDAGNTIFKYFNAILPCISYSRLGFSYNGMHKFLYYICVCMVSFGFLCLIPNKDLGIITKFGRRTIQVYFWHLPIRNILINIGVIESLSYSIWGRILILLLGIALSFILSIKFFSFPTDQVLGLAKKKTVGVLD